ncbi:MAG: glycosyltransferase [Bacteroidetes bacterium]|nr:glycosyltransferase [Bacteroidota bacterium]
MNIIVIGPAYPWRGGIAHFNSLLAKYLCKNHQVEIITFTRQYPKIFFPGKTQNEIDGKSPSVPVVQLIDSINPFNWIKVAKEIRERKPDLLIFKYWLPFFGPCFRTIAKHAKKNSNIKVLFICDNVIPHEKRPGDIAFTKYAFKQSDYFIVQSKSVETDLLSLFPNAKYKFAPHPVYEIFGSPIDKPQAHKTLGIYSEKVILFFGYIRQYKGLMVLLDAMNEIAKTSTPPRLLVVGEFYDDEEKYRNRVKELQLENFVQFVSDYVPNDKVNIYFSAADVVVLPYISATQSGITQIAYNFDKPVISTDVGGLAEVVIDGQTGFIVPPNNPKKLAEAIIKFYSEKKEKEFSNNVKVEKRKYSWKHFVETIEDVVNNN